MREEVLRLVGDADDGPQLEAALRRDLAGDPLVRAHHAVQRLEPLGTAPDLGAEQLEGLGRVGDGLIVDTGHEPVRAAFERVQVPGAFQLVDPQLGERVERGRAGQHARRGGLALPRDRADKPVQVGHRGPDAAPADVHAERLRLEDVGLA